MPIYTKKGDKGETGIFGNKKRIFKSSQIIKTLGAIDEINSYLGIVITAYRLRTTDYSKKKKYIETDKILEEIQGDLLTIGSIIAGAKIEWKSKRVEEIEKMIDEFEKILPHLSNFILPGGGELGSHLMYARTLVRRGEREFVSLSRMSIIKYRISILKYLNRLSDFLFVLARWINWKEGIKEKIWKTV